MSSGSIDCIVADWGTTNRRAWALARDGAVVGERHDDRGLLAHADRRFAQSFAGFCGDWLQGQRQIPVIMAGMVGSKMGWQEVPYQPAPVLLRDLARHLARVEDAGVENTWIVPGIALDDEHQPEVMRGEECQILAALLRSGRQEGAFLLPGTHSKWALVEGGRLVTFRTYMTGEIFGLLRKSSGTLSQLMEDDAVDDDAFLRGVDHASGPDAANLLHSLFSVRTLGLLNRVPRSSLASYMSGLLIGAEIHDALGWLRSRGLDGKVSAIGSPGLLQAYRGAAAHLDLDLAVQDSADLLPVALLSLAKAAALLPES